MSPELEAAIHRHHNDKHVRDRLDQQIRQHCDPGPITARGEVELFMAGIEFACANLIEAAKFIALDQRGTAQSQGMNGKDGRSCESAIIRTGNPHFARALVRFAEIIFAEGQEHARRLYPPFDPPKFYADRPKAMRQQD